MFTLGYAFRPWTDSKAIADGEAIRTYIQDTAREYGVEDKIRFHHQVVSADWSSDDARWTVTARRTDTGETVQLTCSWLSVCSGYYRYDEGFRPHVRGRGATSPAQVIHPQHWPEDFDATGKRIVVIGSGATAVTLVPSLAPDAEHVTMLQRTPSYVLSLPGRDPLAQLLRNKLPATARLSDRAVEERAALHGAATSSAAAGRPPRAGCIRRLTEKQLPAGFDVDTHFNPPYDPWDQRLCLVPDGDLFRTLRRGRGLDRHRPDRHASPRRASQLESGEHLDADVIVTATGLNLLPMGGMALSLDGQPGRRLGDGLLQGDDAVRRPQLRDGHRLHERLLDAQGRPGQPLRLPAAQPPRRRGLRRRPRRSRRPRAPTSRSSTWRRATCSAAWPTCPSRARARRGGCTRTTSATSG